MKRVMLIIVLICCSTGVTGLYGSEITEYTKREVYPELFIWQNGLPIKATKDAVQASQDHYGESPMDGVYYNGKSIYYFNQLMMIKKEIFNKKNILESTYYFTYNPNGDLIKIRNDIEGTYKDIEINFKYEDQIIVRSEKKIGFHKKAALTIYSFNDKNQLVNIQKGKNGIKITHNNNTVIAESYIHGDEDKLKLEYTLYYGDFGVIKEEYPRYKTINCQYDKLGRVINLKLNVFYQTTVYGDLPIAYDDQGSIIQVGGTEIIWDYHFDDISLEECGTED